MNHDERHHFVMKQHNNTRYYRCTKCQRLKLKGLNGACPGRAAQTTTINQGFGRLPVKEHHHV